MDKKVNSGRKKIKIAKIEQLNQRQVAFSKRRTGLFKKACELCTLCGVDMAVVVFSPANKVFSFGHPNVEPLVEKFLAMGDAGAHVSGSSSSANLSVQNGELTEVNEEMEGAKEQKASLERVQQWWWETPVENLGLSQLENLAAALEELNKTVKMRKRLEDEMALIRANLPATQVHGFNGSGGN